MILLMIVSLIVLIINYIYINQYKKQELKVPKFMLCVISLFAYYLAFVFLITGPGTLFDIGKRYEVVISIIPLKDILLGSNSLFSIYQLLANALMFIPFGIFIPIIWPKLDNFVSVLKISFLFSVIIELSQLLNIRATDIDDLLMNTLGGITGYLFYKYIIKRISKLQWLKLEIKKSVGVCISLMFILYFVVAATFNRIIFGF